MQAISTRVQILTAERVFAALVFAVLFFCGEMIVGYAVLDEVAAYAVFAAAVIMGFKSATPGLARLERIHRYVFILFVAYLLAQSLHGIAALSDWRVARFSLMFLMLAAVAVFLPGMSQEDETQPDLIRATLIIGSAYFIAYVAAGLIAENIFGAHRFDIQGMFWSGTAAAVFPICVMLTPLAIAGSSGESRDGGLFWLAYISLLLAAAYYDSRSMRGALLLFIVFVCRSFGLGRFAAIASAYLVLLVYFPWPAENRLTPRNLEGYVHSFVQMDTPGFKARTWNYVEGIFPGVFPIVAGVMRPSREGEKVPVLMERAYRSYDFDRKLAVLATINYVTSDGWGRLLFGGGYYTHRFNLIPAFQQTARDKNYTLPPSYSQIVRSATFNGMLADTGVIGVGLLGALIAISALTIVCSSAPFKLVSLTALLAITISLFSSAQYDMILLYLALFPRGPLLVYHPLRRLTPVQSNAGPN